MCTRRESILIGNRMMIGGFRNESFEEVTLELRSERGVGVTVFRREGMQDVLVSKGIIF